MVLAVYLCKNYFKMVETVYFVRKFTFFLNSVESCVMSVKLNFFQLVERRS